MSIELNRELDTDSEEDVTRTRRVRILQAYTHAIQDIGGSTDDEFIDENDSAFEMHEMAPPNSSNESSVTATQNRRISRGRGLQRQRTISDAMEDIAQMDEDMAPYKLANVLLHGSVATTLPYFTLYSKQLGLDAAQVGMVCGIRPLLVSVVAPLVGLFADKYHMRRMCAILSTALWILFALLIAVVPPPNLAKCDIAVARLQEIFQHENVSVQFDTTCMTHDQHRTVYSVSRHLFLDKVIFQNRTCNNSTNSSFIQTETSLSAFTNNANEMLFERRGVEITVVEETVGQVDFPEDEQTVLRHLVQDGSWLFTGISLQNAFISVFILASFAEMMQFSSISLLDVVTLDSLGRGVKREGYAWQRAFGIMGYVTFSIIIVCILAFSTTEVSICSTDIKFLDYKIAFVVFAGLMACGISIMVSLKFKYEDSHSYSFKEVLNVLATVKYGSIFLTAFVLAVCNGCINTFLLWHLENLGATNLIFILAFFAFGLSEVATSFYLPVFVRSWGHACLVLIGLWIYCFVFVGYALMEIPHWVVLIEIFHGAAFAVTWNPITTYLTGAVCREYLGTMQGLLTGTYHGLGNVIGSLCAGLSVKYYGTAVTFYGFAVLMLVYAILFLVMNRETGLFLTCRKQQRYDAIRIRDRH